MWRYWLHYVGLGRDYSEQYSDYSVFRLISVPKTSCYIVHSPYRVYY